MGTFEKQIVARGVTLVELALAILLIAILATATAYMAGSNVDSARYEATRLKLEKIRTAILGDPSLDNEGRRTTFGYMGDMGRFPGTLADLSTRGAQATWAFNSTLGMGAGWRGPYYLPALTTEDDVSKDAWGTSFVYSTAGVITSYGANKTSGGTGYGTDLTYTLSTVPHRATVYGYVADGDVRLSSKTVTVYYPAGGAITSLSGTTDTTGLFTFSNIPFGFRAFTTTSPTISPKVTAVDKGTTYVPNSLLNYNSSGGIVTDGLLLALDAANNTGSGYSSSASTWVDLTGRHSAGTLNGFASTASSGWNGIGTQADPYRLVFDGTGDYVNFGSILPFEGNRALSISAWVRIAASAAGASIFGNLLSSAPFTGFDLYYCGSSTSASCRAYGIKMHLSSNWGSSAIGIFSGGGAQDVGNDTWHHIGITYSGSRDISGVLLYVDGEQQPTSTEYNNLTSSIASSASTYIGVRNATNSYFTGQVAALHVYNRALTAAEFAQNCYAGKPRFTGAVCP